MISCRGRIIIVCRSITGGCAAVLPAHCVLLLHLLLDVMEDESVAVAVRLAFFKK